MNENSSPSAAKTSPSTAEHRRAGDKVIGLGVITVSDTRTLDNDLGGKLILELSEEAGHKVIDRRIVTDDIVAIQTVVREMLLSEEIAAILVTGGTGLAVRDKTPEAIEPLYDAMVPGYGELFRMLSYAEVGTACMMSRASCGRVGRKIVFTIPGSPSGVRLAMSKVILPELGHLVYHAQTHA